MLTRDFDFDLPEELIAQRPPTRRGDSRLLVLGPGLERHDRRFRDVIGQLERGDLLVFNDTRVVPARLLGRKSSGGRVEILVERTLDARCALAQIRASKSPPPGTLIQLEGGARLTVGEREGEFFRLAAEEDLLGLLEREGHVPLPPYVRRADDLEDRERYQTVYAARPGAVAAPTAGLHFDRELLSKFSDAGIEQAHVTLHVGAGTFQPVRSEVVQEHRMHAERIEVGQSTVDAVARARDRGGRVVAVGTTTVRALESAAGDGELSAFLGDTRIFVYPGYRFRVVDALLTNFHLPGSSLMMMVCAFGGYRRVMAAYAHAVSQRYRFFSYGDAMFLPRTETLDMPPSVDSP